jgi:endoglucanase
MQRIRRILVFMALLAASAAVPATANAFIIDPSGFRLQSAVMTVDQSAGQAEVTVVRDDTAKKAWIRYETTPGSAVRGQDYTAVKSTLEFLPGQATGTFSIPIVNHNVAEPPKTVGIALFSPFPIGMTEPHAAVLTITGGSLPSVVRDPVNPLALSAAPPPSDPLTGATPFVDWRAGLAAQAARRMSGTHPQQAAMLNVIASQPSVMRYGNWSGSNPGLQVAHYLDRAAAEAPGTVPELSTYYVVEAKRSHPRCHHYADPAWRLGAYHRWMQSLASGIGQYRAIVFLEMDSLITVGCLSHYGLQVRLHELHDAIDILSALPRAVVYLDAGAADAVGARAVASLLNRAGVAEIQGFFLNSTHFDWTMKEVRYGQKISRMTGGRHFVVNTAENGRGPLVPRNRVKHGNEILCNPLNRGLGPKPTFNTGLPNVDAFAWIAYPGKSGGACRPGAPPTGAFWPKLALELVRHANFAIR